MRTTLVVALCCVMFVMESTAELLSELGGDLPTTVTADKSPYLVAADLYVPTGKTVTIEPGTVLLFKNFTGLHVRGVLVARGTASHPVVFSSENDPQFNKLTKLNPTPYDWNGIYVHKDGISTEFENVRISYSVKGIYSETKFFRITNGMFSDNGRSNCTIEGEEKVVRQMVPFTYCLSVKDATVDGVSVKILRDPDAVKRNIFRFTGVGVCVGGAVFAGVFGYLWYTSQKDLNKLSDKNNKNNLLNLNSATWVEKRDQRNKNIILSFVGGGLLLAGGISVVYSYSF